MRKLISAVLVAATTASMLIPGVSAAAADTGTDSLRWGQCPKDVTGAGLECAKVNVPLNYRDPDGRKIEIAVSRLASQNPAKRRGVLLTNTGGPGGAGLPFPAVLRDLGLPKEVLDSYDIIGMDPRGVGHSTPVTCDLTPAQRISNIPPYARNSADVTSRAQEAAQIAKQCGSSKSASVLPYINTPNTARDMDQIRAALGESKVSYFGRSYGTYLGSVYATMFPDRGDRIMLDSAAGPGGFDITASRLFGQGFEDRFPDFAQFAAAKPEYHLGDTTVQVKAKYFDIAARLDTKPRPDGFDGKLFRQITFASMYFTAQFPQLAKIWHALDTGKPIPTPPSAGATPTASSPVADNEQASQLHVICNDSNWPRATPTYQRNVATDRIRHPMFGAAGANIWPCASWPSEPTEPPVKITDRGPSNVLILQNRRDPATPLIGARRLRHTLGERARMVTADQGGHLAYLYVKNPCVSTIASTFLATGQRPSGDVACGPGPA